MIYNVQFLVVIFVLLAVTAKAFQMQSSRMSNTGSMRMALSDYREELAKTAAKIASPGNYHFRRERARERVVSLSLVLSVLIKFIYDL